MIDLVVDRVTEAYLDRCLDPESGLRLARVHADFASVLSERVAERVAARPVFVAEREIRSFAADAARIFDIIVSLPERLFDGDLLAYSAALRIPQSWLPLITRWGSGGPPLYGRADMYHDGASFKLLEFNIESNVGGLDRTGEIPRKLLEVPAFAAFAEEHRLSFTHTGEAVARNLRSVGVTTASGREPVVAIIDGRGGLIEDDGECYSVQRMLRANGLEAHVGEIDEVQERDSGLFLRGERIDVVLRNFSAHQIAADPDGERLVEPLFRAHAEGSVVLWTTLDSTLFSNKGCLAMLSDPRFDSVFSPEERAIIDQVVPWTRDLHRSAPKELQIECRERKDEFILKPNALYGGTGIVAGWECDRQTWEDALQMGTYHGCVVQQRVPSRLETVLDPLSGDRQEWEATWGLFLTTEGYAGASVRMLPVGAGAVIGMTADRRTRAGGVFTF